MLTMLAQASSQSDLTVFERVMSHEYSGWLIFGSVVVLCAGFKTVTNVVRSVTRERTRREIAAFIAEGSMTPEQGERLMNSGEKKC